MFRNLDPELATLVDEVPTGDDWLHEVKFDGYRILARIQDGQVRLVSRNAKDWTGRFAAIVPPLENLPVREAWIDGEVVVLDSEGISHFQSLQGALSGQGRLEYFMFDLPWLDGSDLRHTPLLARKEMLAERLESLPAGGLLHYSDHARGNGPAVYDAACSRGLEGIISKQASSTYESRRSRRWLKVKCTRRQEFVIIGYTDPQGSRTGFGALHLGYHDEAGRLRHAGKVGTGFSEDTLKALHSRLRRLERETPPVPDPPRGARARGLHWVEPRLVGEVAFTEWTREGSLRHPAFLGLREDKDPGDIVRETPSSPPSGGVSVGRRHK